MNYYFPFNESYKEVEEVRSAKFDCAADKCRFSDKTFRSNVSIEFSIISSKYKNKYMKEKK
jgi:hypothetical protein